MLRPFRRLVRERRQLRRVREVTLGDTRRRVKCGRLAISERDRACFVEQKHIDVARRLDRAARRRDDVRLNHPVHSGDANRGQKATDRRRNEADEQREEHRDRDREHLRPRPLR